MGEAKRRKLAGEYPAITAKPPPPLPPSAPTGEALSWRIVGDLAAHPKSASVVEALEALKGDVDEFSPGGKTMRVSLEGKPREPILVVESVGLGTFMLVIGVFQDLDLTDRLEHASGPERGVDAAFS